MVLTLIGFMGSGKSGVGKALAEDLNWDFIDMDAYIEAEEGKRIKDIFRKQGEEAFRDMETKALKKILSSSTSLVLATGGGVITRDKNKELLRKSDFIIYLRTKIETVKERLKDDKNRPLLLGEDKEDKITSLYNGRMEQYSELSTHVVDTDSLDIAEVVIACKEFIKLSPEFDEKISNLRKSY